MNILKSMIAMLAFFISVSAYALLDADKMMIDAEKFYQNGEVNKAIELYEDLIANGKKSAVIFYNLGNLYLKKGSIGESVLNYERAKIGMPRDSDLIFNLAYARGKIKQQDLSFQTNKLNNFLIRTTRNISLNENIVIVLSVFSCALILIILGLSYKKIRFVVHIFASIFIVITVLAYVPARYKYYNSNFTAIIVNELTDARYEPDNEADSHFPLYEGNKVYVLRKTDKWMKVKRPDGKIGWITIESAKMLKT